MLIGKFQSLRRCNAPIKESFNPSVAEMRRHGGIVAEKERHLVENFQPSIAYRSWQKYYFLELLFTFQIQSAQPYLSLSLPIRYWNLCLLDEFYSISTIFYETFYIIDSHRAQKQSSRKFIFKVKWCEQNKYSYIKFLFIFSFILFIFIYKNIG